MAVLEGAKGEFSVWLGESLVAGKSNGMFPQTEEVLDLMKLALGQR